MERVTKTRDLLPKEIDNLKEFNDYFLVNDRKGDIPVKKYRSIKIGWVGKVVIAAKKESISHKPDPDYIKINKHSEKNKKYYESLLPNILLV